MITFFNLKVDVNGNNPFSSISGFTLVQRYDRHHSFELRAPLETVEGKGNEVLNKSKNLVGQPIKFEIDAVGASGGSGQKQSEFNGVITSVSVMRYGGTASDLVVRGFSPTIILEHGKNIKAFNNNTLSGLVQSITSKFPGNGINFKVNPSPNSQLAFTLQYKESAFNFIARLANRWGQWFYFNGKDCIFGSLPSSTPIELKFGTDLSVFELGMSMTPTKFKTAGYASIENKAIEVGPQSVNNLDQLGKSAFDSSNKYFFDEQLFHTEQRAADSNTVTDIATARRAAMAGGMVALSGTSSNAKLTIGSSISVKADSDDGTSTIDYGTYTLTSISHTMDGNGHYQNYFESIPSAVTIPPPIVNVYEPALETQTAKVVEGPTDADGRGNVYIRFYWQSDNEEKIGPCRVTYPQAGGKHGIFFAPEVEDEVLVVFGTNNTDRPVIIGSTYNGKNRQEDRADKDNLIKTLRTKGGNEIKFTDKQGEEEISILNTTNGNQITLNMKDNGSILIQSPNGKINMKAKEVNIEGDTTIQGGNITLKAEQKIAATAGTDIELKATNIKANADANAEINATADAKISGLNVTISAQVAATMKGNATAEVSASGETTLKGGIVMIN